MDGAARTRVQQPTSSDYEIDTTSIIAPTTLFTTYNSRHKPTFHYSSTAVPSPRGGGSAVCCVLSHDLLRLFFHGPRSLFGAGAFSTGLRSKFDKFTMVDPLGAGEEEVRFFSGKVCSALRNNIFLLL